MLLERIRIRNVCQLEDLKYKFRPGLIGVVGACGSGKTNFLQCMKATWTNDFSWAGTTKAAKRRRGVPDGEPSFTSAVWRHHKLDIRVCRNIEPSSSKLAAEGLETPLTKQREIERYLGKVSGITTKMLDDYVFVDQWGMRSFLLAKKSARINDFAHLCGADRMERLWEIMGERLSADKSTFVMSGVDVALQRQLVNEKKGLVAATRSRLDAILVDLLSVEVKERAEKAVRRHLQAKQLRGQLAENAKKLANQRRDATRLKDQVALCVSKREKIEQYLKRTKGKYEHANQEGHGAVAAAEAYDRYEKLLKRRDKLRQSAMPQPGLRRQQKAIADDSQEFLANITRMETKLEDAQTKLEAFDSDGAVECPICGTSVDDLHDHLEAMRKIANDYPQKIEELSKQYRNAIDAVEATKVWQKVDERRVTDLDNVLERITDMGEVKPPPDVAALTKVVADYMDKERELSDALEEESDIKAQKARVAGRVEATVTTQEELESRLKKLKPPADVGPFRLQLEKHTAATEEVGEVRSDLRKAESELEEAKQVLSGAAEMARRVKRQTRWLKDLESWRDVVHRENFPKIYMQSVLEDIVLDVNQRLEDFDGPFRVSANEDLAFMIRNNDGSVEPASAKSGGESVVLAIAYRLAVNSRFANDVGMMVLDEPTAGLDEHYLGCLADVLLRVNEVTKKRRQQIFMVTHDQRLERVFDQLIKFE